MPPSSRRTQAPRTDRSPCVIAGGGDDLEAGQRKERKTDSLRSRARKGMARGSLRSRFVGKPSSSQGSSTVGSAVRNLFAKNRAEASKELIKYNRIAADILNNWGVVRGEWVPLLPFAMKIGSDLYHPAHGGDERTRSGSYTRAVNGCFDPTAGGEKKE